MVVIYVYRIRKFWNLEIKIYIYFFKNIFMDLFELNNNNNNNKFDNILLWVLNP